MSLKGILASLGEEGVGWGEIGDQTGKERQKCDPNPQSTTKIRIPLGEPTELVAASQCDLVDHELDFEHEQGGFELGVKTLCKDVGGLEF